MCGRSNSPPNPRLYISSREDIPWEPEAVCRSDLSIRSSNTAPPRSVSPLPLSLPPHLGISHYRYPYPVLLLLPTPLQFPLSSPPTLDAQSQTLDLLVMTPGTPRVSLDRTVLQFGSVSPHIRQRSISLRDSRSHLDQPLQSPDFLPLPVSRGPSPNDTHPLVNQPVDH